MENFHKVITDLAGNAIIGATVTVNIAGTSTLATLYSDNGVTTTQNPTTTNIYGEINVFAANGTYDLVVTPPASSGLSQRTFSRVILDDPTIGVGAPVAFGRVSATGTIVSGVGYTVTKPGTGQYTVALTLAASDVIKVQPETAIAGVVYSTAVGNRTATGFDVFVTDEFGTPTDAAFAFSVEKGV